MAATTYKWGAGEDVTAAITAGLNALGNGNTAISAAIDNATGLYFYIDFELVLASLTTGAGAPSVAVWVLPALDGVNYEDGSAGTPGTVPPRAPNAIFALPASATGALRKAIVNIPIPPYSFKLLLQNNAGAAFAANGSALNYSRHTEQGV